MTVILKALTVFLFALTPIVIEATAAWWVAVSLVGSSIEDRPHRPVNIISSALSDKQKTIIKNHRSPGLIDTIANAAQNAITECQRQFKHRRWNCPSTNPYNVFGQILKKACRETAFVYAITAAAVTHEISRACSNHDLIKSCTCENPKAGVVTKAGWQWGGCGDNIRFADKFARKFLNSTEKHKDSRARINMHNNVAGIKAVRANMFRQCKCHGLSQQCTVRTCWRAVRDFKVIGKVLKEKFDSASQVELEQNNSGRKITFRPVNKDHKPPTKVDLIYYEESPEFCTKNSKEGSLGTVGRECNRTSLGTDGCDLLCCGRGYRSDNKTVDQACNCKFVWCCKVKCEPCRITKNVHLCL